MALYRYVKKRIIPQKKLLVFISYASMLIGSIFLFWSFYPVISFEIYSRIFIDKTASPISDEKTISEKKSSSVVGGGEVYSSNLVDYTKASVWFPSIEEQIKKEKPSKTEKPLSGNTTEKPSQYYLSVPKLSIENSKVIPGGNDLLKGLVHFIPKSYPGEYGHITIFGHSSLPQLYKKGDYKHIFTYLPTLDKGDIIYLKVGDLSYQYKVYDKFIVKPDQVSVLNQQYDNAYLSLITCVPLGTYWNRLVVKAKLTGLPE